MIMNHLSITSELHSEELQPRWVGLVGSILSFHSHSTFCLRKLSRRWKRLLSKHKPPDELSMLSAPPSGRKYYYPESFPRRFLAGNKQTSETLRGIRASPKNYFCMDLGRCIVCRPRWLPNAKLLTAPIRSPGRDWNRALTQWHNWLKKHRRESNSKISNSVFAHHLRGQGQWRRTSWPNKRSGEATNGNSKAIIATFRLVTGLAGRLPFHQLVCKITKWRKFTGSCDHRFCTWQNLTAYIGCVAAPMAAQIRTYQIDRHAGWTPDARIRTRSNGTDIRAFKANAECHAYRLCHVTGLPRDTLERRKSNQRSCCWFNSLMIGDCKQYQHR